MELFYIITLLVVLNCFAFYKRKVLIWSSPIVFVIIEAVLVFGNVLAGHGATLKGSFEGEIGIHTARMIPLCIIISFVASLLTVCFRYLKVKELRK